MSRGAKSVALKICNHRRRSEQRPTLQVMAWVYLIIAGVLEIVWALGMKRTEGFTRLWPSVFTIGFMIISFYLLALAMRSLPAGTAYAVWTGIGAAGTVVLGMFYFGEPRDAARLVCVGLILSGVVGLKFLAKHSAH